LSSTVNARCLKKNVRPSVASYRARLARNLRHLSRREWRDFVKRGDDMTRMYLHGIHADENPDTLHCTPTPLPPENPQSTILIFSYDDVHSFSCNLRNHKHDSYSYFFSTRSRCVCSPGVALCRCYRMSSPCRVLVIEFQAVRLYLSI
jgi:hypothetical protein